MAAPCAEALVSSKVATASKGSNGGRASIGPTGSEPEDATTPLGNRRGPGRESGAPYRGSAIEAGSLTGEVAARAARIRGLPGGEEDGDFRSLRDAVTGHPTLVRGKTWTAPVLLAACQVVSHPGKQGGRREQERKREIAGALDGLYP